MGRKANKRHEAVAELLEQLPQEVLVSRETDSDTPYLLAHNGVDDVPEDKTLVGVYQLMRVARVNRTTTLQEA